MVGCAEPSSDGPTLAGISTSVQSATFCVESFGGGFQNLQEEATMNDFNHNQDGSPTMRMLAHINNPFISSAMDGETLGNVASGLAYIQDLSDGQDEKDAITTAGSTGHYFFLETLRAALKFESDIRGEE